MPNSKYRLVPQDELTTACNMLSGCEQRSVKAERQLMSIKKARFMEKHVGQEFDGVISSVTKFGFFVLLREFDIDGLVKMEQLGNDYFEFNEENLTLVGKRTRKIYSIGEVVQIVVTSANSAMGQIDFALKETLDAKNKASKQSEQGSSTRSQQNQQNHQKNQKHQKHQKNENQKNKRPQQPEQKQKRPKFKSLIDVLDKKGKKDGFTKDKSADRKDSQKRKPDENDRGGFRKARVSKSSGKNKAR